MGSLSSGSGEIFDEIDIAFSKIIAEGTISEKKQCQFREKIPESATTTYLGNKKNRRDLS